MSWESAPADLNISRFRGFAAVRLRFEREVEDLGPSTDDQVILAWLQAEIESPRFQGLIVGNPPNPQALAFVRDLAHHADLGDAAQNQMRRNIIGQIRGFGGGILLFQGLADDIAWRRYHVSVEEIETMLYANHPTWRALAPATLTVGEGMTNVGRVPVPDDPSVHILLIARDICHSAQVPTYPEIICINRPDNGISVMEGHSRATAFVLEAHRLPDGVAVYVGSSPSVATWQYL